jgi:hypothetical protein
MKTLLIFHSNRSAVRGMCESSAMEDVDVLELRPRYKKRPLLDDLVDSYRALTGKGVRLAPLDIDFEKYDAICLVDSLRMLSPSPECNEFLYRCDLGGRDITCLVSNRVRRFGHAGPLLRKRIRLGGGSCRGITFISEADLREEEDVSALALQQQM